MSHCVGDKVRLHYGLELTHRTEQEGEAPVVSAVVKNGCVVGKLWNPNSSFYDASAGL